MRIPALVDDTGTPNTRSLIGRLLSACDEADFAVAHLRVASIDLGADELSRVARCRVLTTYVDAITLGEAMDAAADPALRNRLELLRRYIESGRARVRVSRGVAWAPDFSVYRAGAADPVALVGAHAFARPYVLGGPAFLCAVQGPAARRPLERFEALWTDADDVTELVAAALIGATRRSGT